MRYDLTPFRMAVIKKSISNKCWWGRGEREPLYTVGGNVPGAANMEKSMESLQKTKPKTTIWSSSSIPGIYPKIIVEILILKSHAPQYS